jgi:hypothetical protein
LNCVLLKLRTLIFGFWIALASGTIAEARVVDNVDIRARTDGYEIIVNFTMPIRYQGHAPKEDAAYFVVQLGSNPAAQTTEEDIDAQLAERAEISFDRLSGVPLSQIIYEGGSPRRPTMSFKFTTPVHIEARSSSDQQSLIVTVTTGGKKSQALSPQLEVFDGLAAKEPTSGKEDPRFAAAMEEAYGAMEAGDFHRAIQLYTKVAEQGTGGLRQKAQELLGLARERAGQKNQAKAEYDKYLATYPQGPDADRVRQRLAALVTVADSSKPALRDQKVAARKPKDWRTDVFGSFSQFYFRDDISRTGAPKQVYLSRLTNDVDVNARMRNDSYDIKALFVGSYDKDLLTGGRNDTRVYNLSLEVKGLKNGLFGRVGRQSLSSAGVFGRFDGTRLGYGITPTITLSGIYGYPVERSTDTHINSNRYFYGTSLNIGAPANAWSFSAYALEQRNQGLIDRRAVGGEIKYFENKKSLYLLADYDIFYKDLNLLMLFGTWTLVPGTTVNLNVDYRNSPFLTTKSAIQGQGVNNLDGLFSRFNQDEIYVLAKDRTARSKTATLGITQDLTKKLQLTAEGTASTLSGTISSGGVDGYLATGTDLFFNTQLIASDLFTANDIVAWGLRYYKTSNYHSYGTTLNTRFPITENLRINPRILVDYRKSDVNGSKRVLIRPLVRLDYRLKKWLRLEAEGGVEWQDETFFGLPQKSLGTFFYVGYRASF